MVTFYKPIVNILLNWANPNNVRRWECVFPAFTRCDNRELSQKKETKQPSYKMVEVDSSQTCDDWQRDEEYLACWANVRQMQMKAAVEFHLFQVRMTTIYAYIYADVGKGVEQKEPLGTAGKVVNQHSTVGDSGTHWRADTRTFVQSGFPTPAYGLREMVCTCTRMPACVCSLQHLGCGVSLHVHQQIEDKDVWYIPYVNTLFILNLKHTAESYVAQKKSKVVSTADKG